MNNYSEVIALLKNPININLQDHAENTALIYAALKGYIDVVKMLGNR